MPKIREKEKFPVRLLVTQNEEERLQPYMLPAFFALGQDMALILGCVSKACLHQRSKAVSGSRAWWGRLLGCGSTRAYELVKSACDQGLLERLPQFVAQRGYGREGEHIDNRQIDTCYRPGLRLKSMWLAYHNELANRHSRRSDRFRSTGDGSRYPSLRSKSFTSSIQDTADASPALLIGKVPPLAASIDSQPMAAQGSHRSSLPCISVSAPNIQPALGGPYVAAVGGQNKLANMADGGRSGAAARHQRPITDDQKQCLDKGALNTAHARALWAMARPDDVPTWVPAGDTTGIELAMMLARVTAKYKE